LLGLVRLLGERGLLDGLDLDVHLAEDVDDLVELLGGGAVADLAAVAGLIGDRRGGPGPAGAGLAHLSDGFLHVSLLWPLHAEVPSRAQPGRGARITGVAHTAGAYHLTGVVECPEQSRNRVALGRG